MIGNAGTLSADVVQRYGAQPDTQTPPRFSFGTLVTDPEQYSAMRRSFEAGGFTTHDCEFLAVDNTGTTQTDAYAGLNALLDQARAPIVVLCHQDVRLLDDDRNALQSRLDELDRLDPHWAVAGNSGGVKPGQLALRITDPHGRDQSTGPLPQPVHALDENLLIVRRASRVGFSHDLKGFHLYGADLCLHAAVMGCRAYVIDFHLEHLSPGRKDLSFDVAEAAFRAKWSAALKPRWLQTTCTLMFLSGNPAVHSLGRVVAKPVAKIARRLPGAAGWRGSKTTSP